VELEAVVMKCLEKDPARRYATAEELAEDLRRWSRGEAVRARSLTWRYRSTKFIHRQRRAIALTAGLVCLQALLVLGLVALLANRPDNAAPQGPFAAATMPVKDGTEAGTVPSAKSSEKEASAPEPSAVPTPAPHPAAVPQTNAYALL